MTVESRHAMGVNILEKAVCLDQREAIAGTPGSMENQSPSVLTPQIH